MEVIHPAMPPDSLAAPWPYHLRLQGAVFLAVPFPSHVRVEDREGGLEARTGSCTHGTSFAVHPSRDYSGPDMAGIIDVCVSNRHLVSRAILSGHATTGKPRGVGATAPARD